MKVLAVNAGSSSLKFQMYEMPEEKVLISGVFERIGIGNSFYTIKLNGEKIRKDVELANHSVAVGFLTKELLENNIVDSLEEIKGVGTNMLIQKGAKLVLNPNDILEDFGIEPLYFEYTESITTTPLFIPDEYKKIYNFLSSTPININALSKKTCLSINELNSKLTMMEIEGYIKSLPCNEYVRL